MIQFPKPISWIQDDFIFLAFLWISPSVSFSTAALAFPQICKALTKNCVTEPKTMAYFSSWQGKLPWTIIPSRSTRNHLPPYRKWSKIRKSEDTFHCIKKDRGEAPRAKWDTGYEMKILDIYCRAQGRRFGFIAVKDRCCCKPILVKVHQQCEVSKSRSVLVANYDG